MCTFQQIFTVLNSRRLTQTPLITDLWIFWKMNTHSGMSASFWRTYSCAAWFEACSWCYCLSLSDLWGFKGKPAIGLFFFLMYNTENVGQGHKCLQRGRGVGKKYTLITFEMDQKGTFRCTCMLLAACHTGSPKSKLILNISGQTSWGAKLTRARLGKIHRSRTLWNTKLWKQCGQWLFSTGNFLSRWWRDLRD